MRSNGDDDFGVQVCAAPDYSGFVFYLFFPFFPAPLDGEINSGALDPA
jgi:hypothetical protein